MNAPIEMHATARARGVAAEPATDERRLDPTSKVLDNHLQCFAAGDLAGVLSDYAPDAVLFTPDSPLRGVEAIRPLFEALIAEFRKPGAAFGMKTRFVVGDYAYILWTAETADNTYEFATDTFVVRGGRIVAQSFAAKVVPRV